MASRYGKPIEGSSNSTVAAIGCSALTAEQSVHDLIEMARQLEEAAARYRLS